MSLSVHNLSVTLSGVECPGSRWQQLAEDWLVQLPDRHRGEGCVYEREYKEKSGEVEWTVFVCVCVCAWLYVLHVCARWVALSSPRLSAGSVGFGADCDVTADPLSCGPVHLFCLSLSLFLSPCLSGAGGGEHFEALWRFPEAAEPQGLPERRRCLHEVRFSLSPECGSALTFTKTHSLVGLSDYMFTCDYV